VCVKWVSKRATPRVPESLTKVKFQAATTKRNRQETARIEAIYNYEYKGSLKQSVINALFTGMSPDDRVRILKLILDKKVSMDKMTHALRLINEVKALERVSSVRFLCVFWGFWR
jgi:hypothetical protein